MDYLLFLHKYEMDRTRMTKKLKALGARNIQEEEKGLFVQGNFTITDLTQLGEIREVYLLTTTWEKFGFVAMKKASLNALKDRPQKTYTIKTRFYQKIPLSARSIYKHVNPYLKHEGFHVVTDNPAVILYIEFKKEHEQLFYRVGIQPSEALKKNHALRIPMETLAVALEEPELVTEIADFIRVCYIFKLDLYILTKNEKMPQWVERAKRDVKGIAPEFTVFITPELPKGYVKIGFTKHAKANEKNMQEYFTQPKRTLLIFGNDKYGLSQHIREQLDYTYRLTPELKKPLRASHALSYVLGFYTHMKLPDPTRLWNCFNFS